MRKKKTENFDGEVEVLGVYMSMSQLVGQKN